MAWRICKRPSSTLIGRLKIEQNNSPYIETVSGIKFHFLEPKEDEINIKDIAFALANQCRFNGHIPFFSVAEHSVAVAARLSPNLQLAGLLHDAAEAYLSDIPSPIKQYLPDYQAMETKVQNAINKKFGVEFHPDVKTADVDATATEAYYLLKSRGKDWNSVFFQPNPKWEPRCLNPLDSYKLFMTWFSDLTKVSSSDGERKLILV